MTEAEPILELFLEPLGKRHPLSAGIAVYKGVTMFSSMENLLEDKDEGSMKQDRAETGEKPSPKGVGKSQQTTLSVHRPLFT